MDTLDTSLVRHGGVKKRTYRRHSAEFKRRVVESCLEPGASVAGIALAHQLNANLVRRWVKEQREGAPRGTGGERSGAAMGPRGETRPATLIPVALVGEAAPGVIEVEIRRSGLVVQVRWPEASAQTCADWLGGLLG